jgi:hypothetical protein
MTLFLIILALLGSLGIVWTTVEVARDGYGPKPTLDRDALPRWDRR